MLHSLCEAIFRHHKSQGEKKGKCCNQFLIGYGSHGLDYFGGLF